MTSEAEAVPPPPDGFVLTQGRGQFSTHNGPYFTRPSQDGLVEQAFFALPRHCNGVGLVHGGMLSAFMDGVLAGEGEPDEVIQSRGLAVVSDDSALQQAVDQALAAQPGVADKIRAGKLQAAGAIVGAVMKATRGQADAARVRELVLSTLGVQG